MKSAVKKRGPAGSLKLLVGLALLMGLQLPGWAAEWKADPADRLVVGRGADRQLELFAVDADGQLKQRAEDKSNGDWSPWCRLGGLFLPGIAVANGADGRLRVFAVERTTHALKYISQNETNNLDWSQWVELGGNVRPPLAVVPNADGRLEVFAVGLTNGRAQHIWQTGSNGNWSSWVDLGGAVEPGLAAARNRDGRLEIFGIQAGGHGLAHCWQQAANTTNNWSDWSDLGGAIQPGFAVGQNTAGCLEVFAAQQGSSRVIRAKQLVPGASTSWWPWSDFAEYQGTNPPPSTRDFVTQWKGLGTNVDSGLVVGKSGDGRLEVFAVEAGSGNLLHRWETMVRGEDLWSPWAAMGITAQPGPVVATNEDGDLELFARDKSEPDLIHHRRQISSASDWLDWTSLDDQTPQYYSRTWQSDEGLPDNLVQAITQTADGFLWVGTRSGLARFDGNQFFCYDSRNTPALEDSSITALCADHDGSLWIGTDGGGLVRLRAGSFTRYSATNGLAGNAIRVIYQAHDGSVWVGTTTGMSRLQNGQIRSYLATAGLLSEVVRSIYEDREGDLWIATGKGLNRLRRDGTVDAFPMPNGLPNDSVRAICQDQGGRIWIGSNNGLLWYNWFWGKSFYAYNTKYGLSDTFVSAICEGPGGNLWVGTYSGLNRFHEGRFYSQPDSDGQPFDKVNALYVDREGDLWVGSKEGLSRLTQQHFFTYTKQQGLTHNNVMSVLQDKTGDLWVGTWGGGLDQLHNGQVTAHASTNGVSQDLILSLCAGRDGSVWAGADFDGGLMRLKDGQITRYTWHDGLINAGLRVLHEDPAGNLWIGTDRGMSCFSGGQFVTNRVIERLAGVSVRDICEDRSGGLWFATQNGLNYWQGRQLVAFTKADGLSDNSLTALCGDSDGTLWIGTSSGGLVRCRQGAFTSYRRRHGLFSDEIFGIVEDNQGWLWMSCTRGIFRVRKRDLDAFDRRNLETIPCLVYGKNDGMKSPQCNGSGRPSAWKTSDGRLWFPTSKGLVWVDPRTVNTDSKPPAVFIEGVVADSKSLEDGRTNLAGATSVLACRFAPLQAPPGPGELEFQYTALDFSAPERIRYQYRLETADSDWVDAGGRRVAYYNHLAPGDYRFKVRACNRDGAWSLPGTELEVVLRPHYWQTLWFRGALALAIVGGASGLALYGTRRRMQRQLAILEKEQAVEKERGRIAKDMHDQIGAGLTQIGLLGELTRRDNERNGDTKLNAEKICGLARELAQTVDEIVWTVNPRNDTLNKLGAYLAAYAEDYFQGMPMRCRLDIPPGLPAYPLSAELRHNLFLTVKEALNNIAKHSRATEARLELAVGAAGLELVIEDNGAGISAPASNSPRNGLSNMRERIEEIGGRIEIVSEPQKGTRIFLRVPIKDRREAIDE